MTKVIFKNNNNEDIAKIRFVYKQMGTVLPLDWVLELYYWSPNMDDWVQLNTDAEGYLYNNWYKLVVEANGQNFINYSLYKSVDNLVDFKNDVKLGSSFSDLKCVKWSNNNDPVVCPMFFWDEHKIKLTNS